MKLLRTIRLDASDAFVFERAAEPGEWAVSGAFLFAEGDPASLSGKPMAAFRSGLLGVSSLGWSTLAVVIEATDAERDAAIETLAARFRERLGAPDAASARAAAAAEELGFAAGLAEHPTGTLVAVQRTAEHVGIRERFRTFRPRDAAARAPWATLPVFSAVEAPDDEAAEEVDLVRLTRSPKQ